MSDDANIAVAIYDYKAKDGTELSMQKNDRLVVLDDSQPWWRVKNEKNLSGYVPSNYLERKGSKKTIMGQLKTKMGGKAGNKANTNETSQSTNKVLGKTGNKILEICIAKYHYSANRDDELDVKKGDQILVIEKENDGWWKGECNGKVGWFPNNYVDAVDSKDSMPMSEYAVPSDVMSGFNKNGGGFEQVICKVQTLYPFSSQSNEELSFEKGIMLEIIEKPKDDPDWWKAKTPQGEIGLVPRNYVQEVEVIDESPVETQSQAHQFADEDWYHGKLVRVECEKLLHDYGKVEEFLLRESESRAGDFSLSMKAPNRIKHFRIKVENNQYEIGKRTFDSIHDLINHYRTSPIFTTDSGEKLYLKSAFSKAISKSRNLFGQ